MRELWRDINSFMETRWQRPLFVQRLWTLLQNEWAKQATHQAQTQTSKSFFSSLKNWILTLYFSFRRLQGAKEPFAPTAKHRRQLYGDEITTESPFAMLADCTISCIT